MSQSEQFANNSPCQEARLISFSHIDQLNTCSLILSAAGVSHRINIISPNQIEIFVGIDVLQEAKDELDQYEAENRHWPPPQPHDTYSPIFLAMTPIVIAALIYIYGLSGDWSHDGRLFAAGAGDSAAILSSHELYRLITALTLHADAVHLMGNCFLGGFLLHFLLLTTGNGIGLFTVLISSAVANLVNVVLHGPGHLFVGFSTAVFVVIGMLCIIGFAGKTKQSFFSLLMPVMAGLALLALLGSSGERTDLGGHLFGLLCGLLAGNIVKLPHFKKLRDSIILQSTLSIATYLIVWLCWVAALTGSAISR